MGSMRTSYVDAAVSIRDDVRYFRGVQDQACEPFTKAYLKVGDRTVEMKQSEVDAVIDRRWREIESAAQAIGLEIDE